MSGGGCVKNTGPMPTVLKCRSRGGSFIVECVGCVSILVGWAVSSDEVNEHVLCFFGVSGGYMEMSPKLSPRRYNSQKIGTQKGAQDFRICLAS